MVNQVEGYRAELVLSSCYDFVEKCCDFVSKHVSVMQKVRYIRLYNFVFMVARNVIFFCFVYMTCLCSGHSF